MRLLCVKKFSSFSRNSVTTTKGFFWAIEANCFYADLHKGFFPF